MTNKKIAQRLTCAATVVCMLMLHGCSTIDEAERNTRIADQRARQLLADHSQNAAPAGVTRLSAPRIAGQEIKLQKTVVLPAVFDSHIAYTSPGTQKLSEVLQELSTRVGLAIIGTEILSASQSGQPQSAATSAQNAINGYVQVDFEGTFKSLLNDLAQRNQASWRYVKVRNTVEFFRFETRTFAMHLPGGAKSLQASISLSATGGQSASGGNAGNTTSGGGTGTVSVTQNQSIDPWTSIMSSVQAILGLKDGSNSQQNQQRASSSSMGTSNAPSSSHSVSGLDGFASATPELGIVTVTARPHSLQRISSLLNSINARFARNVMVDVTVYNVSLSKEQSAGLSLDLVYKRLNGDGISIAGSAPLQPSSGSTPGQMTVSFANPTSRFNGTKLIAQALNSVGNVALFKKGQFLAINGQPSPFQVVEDEEYITSTSTSQTANVGSQTSTQKANLTTGLTANVLPLILGDNRILLQYQMELSSVVAMNPSIVNGVTTYSPKISRQSFQQQAFLKDGDAIVLFGFDSGAEQVNGQVSIAGASKSGRGDRNLSVIVMQVYGGQKNG